jgi:hypothetical protein
VTGPAGRPLQAQPTEPAATERTFLYQFSGKPRHLTRGPQMALILRIRRSRTILTAKADTLLGEVGVPTNPTTPLRKAHSCGMRTRPPQARPGLPGQRTYVTEIVLPPTDNGSTGSTRSGEMALPVVPVAYLRQLPESRALVLAMNRSPIAVKVRPVWRRASFRLRANPPAYVPMPGPVAFPQIKLGADGEAA